MKTQQGRNKLNGCVPYAWRTIKRTLALAAASDQIPPPGTLALAQWVLEQKIGKPTVRVESHGEVNVVLDPSKYLQALRESAEITAPYRLVERENGSYGTLPSQSISDNCSSANVTSVNTEGVLPE